MEKSVGIKDENRVWGRFFEILKQGVGEVSISTPCVTGELKAGHPATRCRNQALEFGRTFKAEARGQARFLNIP
jgi:hypothetical protein